MTLKIKTVYFCIFRGGLQNNFIGKLKVTKWNGVDTDSKNKSALFTHCISFTGPLQP